MVQNEPLKSTNASDESRGIIHQSNTIRRILVPLDGSENAFRAASFAVTLAKKYDAELIAIHALQLNQSLSYLGTFGMPTPQHIADMMEATKNQVSPWFDRVKKDATALKVKMRTEIIKAPLSVVGDIVTYAENNQVDMIVVGSRGRTGFKKLLLGSVASGIVTYANCPVVVIK